MRHQGGYYLYFYILSSVTAQRIATEWQGATPGVVSGIERTRSPIANNAGGKSTPGAGRASAAENKMR